MWSPAWFEAGGVGGEGDMVFAGSAVEAVVDAIGVEEPGEVAAGFGDR